MLPLYLIIIKLLTFLLVRLRKLLISICLEKEEFVFCFIFIIKQEYNDVLKIKGGVFYCMLDRYVVIMFSLGGDFFFVAYQYPIKKLGFQNFFKKSRQLINKFKKCTT